jgi:hypothetical protein
MVARGLCSMHYQRELSIHPEHPRSLFCSIEGCERRSRARGWCEKHYARWRAHGDPLATVPRKPTKRRDPVERFWEKVDKSAGPNGCWLWTAADKGDGYGYFYVGKVNGRVVLAEAHRFAYQLQHGPIPEGMPLDHVCRVHQCVNPLHLRVVTHKQNLENRAPEGRGRSGIRGVVWISKSGRWRVQARHNYRRYVGGEFEDLAEAEQAAIALRNQLFTHNDADRRG